MIPAPYYRDIASGPAPEAFYTRTSDGTRIRLAVWPGGTRGTILLLQGRSEYLEKYGATYAAFRARGFSIAALDWRGQGLSTRPLGHTRTGHVADFALFQSDLSAALAHPAIAALTGPRILVAHSMGGCIGLAALIAGLKVEAALFSAPMWGIKLPLSAIARPLASALRAVGLGAIRVPGTGALPYTVWHPAKGNLLTSDHPTYEAQKAQLQSAPDLGLGGPSFGWIASALNETTRLARLPNPQIPMRVLVGSEEGVVLPQAIHARMAPEGITVIPGGRHEMFFEAPAIKSAFWQEIDSFLAAHT